MAPPEKKTSVCVTPKITPDMIKCFNGEGDLVAWLAKAKLVARLAKITDLANFLPLYLEGDALALYLEMGEMEQGNIHRIEAKLKEAFTDGPFVAYSKLISKKWSGEPVDVFATELRRLIGLAGMKGEGAETLIRLAFVNGFPEAVSVELQQIEGVDEMKVSDLLSRARILVGSRTDGVGAVSASHVGNVSHRQSGKMGSREKDGSASKSYGNFKRKCFNCDSLHLVRNCPEKKPVTCYKCGKEGHLSYDCESGN